MHTITAETDVTVVAAPTADVAAVAATDITATGRHDRYHKKRAPARMRTGAQSVNAETAGGCGMYPAGFFSDGRWQVRRFPGAVLPPAVPAQIPPWF